MNLRNALRYIYIYIYRLNFAKAGWEYDLQPREKRRRKGVYNQRAKRCHHKRNKIKTGARISSDFEHPKKP